MKLCFKCGREQVTGVTLHSVTAPDSDISVHDEATMCNVCVQSCIDAKNEAVPMTDSGIRPVACLLCHTRLKRKDASASCVSESICTSCTTRHFAAAPSSVEEAKEYGDSGFKDFDFVHARPTFAGGQEWDMATDPTFKPLLSHIPPWTREHLKVEPTEGIPGFKPATNPSVYMQLFNLTILDEKPSPGDVAAYRAGRLNREFYVKHRDAAEAEHGRFRKGGVRFKDLQMYALLTGGQITGHLTTVLTPITVFMRARPPSSTDMPIGDVEEFETFLTGHIGSGVVKVEMESLRPMYGFNESEEDYYRITANHTAHLRCLYKILKEDGWELDETPFRQPDESGCAVDPHTQFLMRTRIKPGGWVQTPLSRAKIIAKWDQTTHAHLELHARNMYVVKPVDMPRLVSAPRVVISEDAELNSHRPKAFPIVDDPDDYLAIWSMVAYRMHWDEAKTGLRDGCIGRFILTTLRCAPSPNFITVPCTDELALAQARRRIITSLFTTDITGFNTLKFDLDVLHRKVDYWGRRRGRAMSRWFPSHVYSALDVESPGMIPGGAKNRDSSRPLTLPNLLSERVYERQPIVTIFPSLDKLPECRRVIEHNLRAFAAVVAKETGERVNLPRLDIDSARMWMLTWTDTDWLSDETRELARLAVEFLSGEARSVGDEEFLSVLAARPAPFEVRVDAFRKGISRSFYNMAGRLTHDMYSIYKTNHAGESSFSLKALTARKLKGVPAKIDLSYSEQFRRYRHAATWEGKRLSNVGAARSLREITEVAEYCDWDAILALLHTRRQGVLSDVMMMGFVTQMDPAKIYMSGQMGKVFCSMCFLAYEEGFSMTRYPDGFEGKFQGATVVSPEPRHFDKEYVTSLDFTSLYPSIMMWKNLCPSMLLLGDTVEEARRRGIPFETFKIGSQEFHFVKREHRVGIFPKILGTWLAQRKVVKAAMKRARDASEKDVLNALQLAYKRQANSAYGFMGTHTSPVCCFPIAVATTSTGRASIEGTIRFIHEKLRRADLAAMPEFAAALAELGDTHGWSVETAPFDPQVVYGDTDSVMIRLPIANRPELKEVAFKVARFMGKWITKELFEDPMDLKFEYVAETFMLVQKKWYAAMISENERDDFELYVKGIDSIVKRSTPACIRQCMSRVIPMIIRDSNMRGAMELVVEFLNRLARERIPIEAFARTVEVGELSEGDDSLAHLSVAHERMLHRMQREIEAGTAGTIQLPAAGSRVPVVNVFSVDKRLSLSDRLEMLDWVYFKKLRPDLGYMATLFANKLVRLATCVPEFETMRKMALRVAEICRANQMAGTTPGGDVIRLSDFVRAEGAPKRAVPQSMLGAMSGKALKRAMRVKPAAKPGVRMTRRPNIKAAMKMAEKNARLKALKSQRAALSRKRREF